MATAEKLLLDKPHVDLLARKTRDLVARPAEDEEEPIDIEALRRAAETGDLRGLAKLDRRLQKLLDADDQIQLLREGDLADPQAKAALRLYRDSYMSLVGSGRNVEKEARQAVMKDDVVALKALLGKGLHPDSKTPGGHTLLELAREKRASL